MSHTQECEVNMVTLGQFDEMLPDQKPAIRSHCTSPPCFLLVCSDIVNSSVPFNATIQSKKPELCRCTSHSLSGSTYRKSHQALDDANGRSNSVRCCRHRLYDEPVRHRSTAT